MIYVDATNQVLGRLASSVAKTVLNGESVCVVNAEKAVIVGNPSATIRGHKESKARGDPYHGPFYHGNPDKLFKRTVRGMLPYKTARGREAFKRIKAFISIPSEAKGKKFTKMDGTENKGEQKCITLEKLSERV